MRETPPGPPASDPCALHGATATHRCDGCGRPLCEACFDVGHKLLFCKHCGERAVPLVEEGPANASELARQRRRRTPYTLREALGYPFRGLGAFVFWGTILFAGVTVVVIVSTSLIFSLPAILLALGALYLAPGLSFAIVRRTAEGNDELPDWPDWTQPGRFAEVVAMLVLGFMAVLPAGLLVSLSACEAGLLLDSPGCLLLGWSGLLLGAFLFVPALGATASFGNPWLAVRWDLHARALARTWRDSTRLALIMVGLYLFGGALGWGLSFLPLVGWLLRIGIQVYSWFLGMHLIGLLVRRHEDVLETIYFD